MRSRKRELQCREFKLSRVFVQNKRWPDLASEVIREMYLWLGYQAGGSKQDIEHGGERHKYTSTTMAEGDFGRSGSSNNA
jgi:hypothetical protein